MNSQNDFERADSLCAQMLEFAWEGNITPIQWYQHLRFADGKPHLPAITILSDIAYWYRPVEVRDPFTGELTGYRRKFKGHKLQRSHGYYERLFGFSEKQVRGALDFLETQGIIQKEVVPVIELSNGQRIWNVLYLELQPDKLRAMMKPKPSSSEGVCPTGHTPCPVGHTYTEN